VWKKALERLQSAEYASKTEGHRFESSSVRQKKPRQRRGFSFYLEQVSQSRLEDLPLECHDRRHNPIFARVPNRVQMKALYPIPYTLYP